MSDDVTPSWIALGRGEPFGSMAALLDGERLRVVEEPEAFGRLLATCRPEIALLGAPPATGEVEALTLRERRRRPGLRIVHLTPPEDVERRLDALRRGFDDALVTTTAARELIDRLAILATRGRVRPAAEIPVADGVVLDRIAHEVRRDGQLVHLRPREFQLLAMFAAHPGRAFTRRQLLDRVWGPGHHGDPRTVDVHVRWLRAKIERIPAAPTHLVTVRGTGYRLDPTGS